MFSFYNKDCRYCIYSKVHAFMYSRQHTSLQQMGAVCYKIAYGQTMPMISYGLCKLILYTNICKRIFMDTPCLMFRDYNL